MNYYGPERYTDQLLRAVLTVLVAAGGIYLAWRLLAPLLPLLFVLGMVLAILRFAMGSFGRRGW